MFEGHQEINELGGVCKVHGEAVNEGCGDVVGGEDIGYCFGDVFWVLCYASLCLLDGGFIGLSAREINTFGRWNERILLTPRSLHLDTPRAPSR